MPGGMRVIKSSDGRPTLALRAPRGDEHTGIDLEMGFGPRMDITRRDDRVDPPAPPQQNAAGLLWRGGAGFGQQGLAHGHRKFQP